MGFFSDLRNLSQSDNFRSQENDKSVGGTAGEDAAKNAAESSAGETVAQEADVSTGQAAEVWKVEELPEDTVRETADPKSGKPEAAAPQAPVTGGREPEAAAPQVSESGAVTGGRGPEAAAPQASESGAVTGGREPEAATPQTPESGTATGGREPGAENAAAPQEEKGEVQKEESKGAEETMEVMEVKERVVLDETSVITTGMVVTGDINTEGSVDVAGTVNGNIDAYGKLNITGHINGNSKAAEIYAENAKINGQIVSDGAVKIESSTVIIGNITATSAAIAGAVKGDIDVKGPVILDASAIVMGNIKSKSVQINNGAVIEGMCSQCYADVNPVSFFDDYKPEVQTKSKSK